MMILLFVCFGFFLIGFVLVLSEYQARRDSYRVRGQVVGFTNSAGASSSRFFFPVARYQSRNGQTFYLVSNTGSSAPLHQVGDWIGVFVKKKDPTVASVQSTFTLVLGSLFLMIGSVLIYFFSRTASEDPFLWPKASAVVIVLLLGFLKIRRKVPLTQDQWKALKKKKTFTEEEKEQILWCNPEILEQSVSLSRQSTSWSIPICALLAAVCFLGAFGSLKQRPSDLQVPWILGGFGALFSMATWHSYKFRKEKSRPTSRRPR